MDVFVQVLTTCETKIKLKKLRKLWSTEKWLDVFKLSVQSLVSTVGKAKSKRLKNGYA